MICEKGDDGSWVCQLDHLDQKSDEVAEELNQMLEDTGFKYNMLEEDKGDFLELTFFPILPIGETIAELNRYLEHDYSTSQEFCGRLVEIYDRYGYLLTDEAKVAIEKQIKEELWSYQSHHKFVETEEVIPERRYKQVEMIAR